MHSLMLAHRIEDLLGTFAHQFQNVVVVSLHVEVRRVPVEVYECLTGGEFRTEHHFVIDNIPWNDLSIISESRLDVLGDEAVVTSDCYPHRVSLYTQ